MTMSETPKEYVPMIKEVSIENFKGIKHCEIKDIGKVNLFIGRNGCGKSSIMEAMYFTGKEFLRSTLPQCIQRRANRTNWSARELWYDYVMDSDVNVKLGFNEDNFVAMSIRFSPENGRIMVYFSYGGPEMSVGHDVLGEYDILLSARSRRNVERHSPHSKENARYFDNSVFVDPTIKTDVIQIEGSYLNRVELSEESRQDLAKRMSEIYGTEPRWGFLPHQDFSAQDPSRFTIFEGKRRLFLDNFGDGLHYGLAVMVIAKTHNNTALFIEEIESHQHPEAIRSLVANLLSIAKMNKLQLFITTHNQDVWRYLYYYYRKPEERKKKFRCFHVTRDKNSGAVEAKIEEGMANIQPDLDGIP